MKSESYRKIVFSLILLVLVIVSFLIIKPFITAVLTGVIFSYIFYPVYSKICKKITNKNISSLIASIFVVLIITIPLFFVLNTVSKEVRAIETNYKILKQKMISGEFQEECQNVNNPICGITNYITDTVSNPEIRYYFDATVDKATSKIEDIVSDIVFSIPIYMLNMFIVLFVMFFLFKDGKILVNKIEKILPLKSKYRKHVFKKLDDMTYAVIYGSIVIAIIQGILGGIGFAIFGVPSPLLWGIVMIFASLIPYIGSSIIWFPAALMLIFNGYFNSEINPIIKGVLLILYGILIVGTADNILKPKIIGDKGGLHPVLVLLGVVGGLMSPLGFIGMFVGPIILAMLVVFIKIYEEEKQ